MGTTSFAHNGRDTISLLKKELEGENSFGKWEWLAHAERGNVVYVVIKRTPKIDTADPGYVRDEDGSYRAITVVLTTRNGVEFSYRDISETAGPVEKDCPERLLKLASDFREGCGAFGPEWRAGCRARRTAMRANKAAAPKPGDHFRTLKPVDFRDGTSHSEFTCVRVRRRGRMATVYQARGTSTLYRFKPATFGFEIIAAHAVTAKGGEP